jgi:hypothetical protein
VAERIVEVEREDSSARHGWSEGPVKLHCACRTVGYVIEDDDRSMVLAFGRDDDENSGSPFHCTIVIPRSAIRKVTERGRKG